MLHGHRGRVPAGIPQVYPPFFSRSHNVEFDGVRLVILVVTTSQPRDLVVHCPDILEEFLGEYLILQQPVLNHEANASLPKALHFVI